MVANINLLGLPDYTGQSGQTGSKYPIAIDAAMQALAQVARNFSPHASEAGSPSAPDMTVTLDPGRIWNPVTRAYAVVASQATGAITAPAANPRRDIVYIDRLTGVVGVTTGSEAASPADPTIPIGKLPVARLNLIVGMTVIDDTDIDDLRTLAMLGAPLGHGDELSRVFPGSSSPDEFVRGTLDELPLWQKTNGLWRCVQPRHLLDGLDRLDVGSPSLELDDVNDLIPVWCRSKRELMMIAAGEVGGGRDDFVEFQDQKASNTSGDTYATGAWRTVTLNTEVDDTAAIGSVSSNQMTLAAGSYTFTGWANVGTNETGSNQFLARLRLQNVTDGSSVRQGVNAGSETHGTAYDGMAQTVPAVQGRFAIAAPKIFELQVYVKTQSIAPTPLTSGDVEVYASIMFRRYA
jgi:hypothetical protein